MVSSCMLQTKRLVLRQWRKEDLEPFTAMNADSRVMEFFPSLYTLEESKLFIQKATNLIETLGWGLWAVSLHPQDEFIGFIGLHQVDSQFPFAPAVEVGWRLGFPYWGKGYATEGALAALQYGFETLQLNEIVSFTAVQNVRSRAVMQRIGMHHNPKDDFNHPKLPHGHPLQRHVLYRITSFRKT